MSRNVFAYSIHACSSTALLTTICHAAFWVNQRHLPINPALFAETSHSSLCFVVQPHVWTSAHAWLDQSFKHTATAQNTVLTARYSSALCSSNIQQSLFCCATTPMDICPCQACSVFQAHSHCTEHSTYCPLLQHSFLEHQTAVFLFLCNHTYGHLPCQACPVFQPDRHCTEHSTYYPLLQHSFLKHHAAVFVLLCNHTYGHLPMPGLLSLSSTQPLHRTQYLLPFIAALFPQASCSSVCFVVQPHLWTSAHARLAQSFKHTATAQNTVLTTLYCSTLSSSIMQQCLFCCATTPMDICHARLAQSFNQTDTAHNIVLTTLYCSTLSSSIMQQCLFCCATTPMDICHARLAQSFNQTDTAQNIVLTTLYCSTLSSSIMQQCLFCCATTPMDICPCLACSGFQGHSHCTEHSTYSSLFQRSLLKQHTTVFVLLCNHTYGHLPMPGFRMSST